MGKFWQAMQGEGRERVLSCVERKRGVDCQDRPHHESRGTNMGRTRLEDRHLRRRGTKAGLSRRHSSGNSH